MHKFIFQSILIFQVQDLGLTTAYVSNDRVRKIVWHMLSLAHIPIERHPEAEDIIQEQVNDFLDEV